MPHCRKLEIQREFIGTIVRQLERKTTDHWQVFHVPSVLGREVAQAADFLVTLDGEILTDRRRSLVKVVDFAGHRLVLKQPRNKNRNAWIRLTTHWRPGNAMGCLTSLLRLEATGLAASAPVAVFEKRRRGRVVDSWLIYEYCPGTEVPPERYGDIVGYLNRIHETGWLHKDPHIENFLLHNDQIFAIDIELVENKYGPVGPAYNWRRLTTRHGETVPIAGYFDFDTRGWAYRTANTWFDVRYRYREARKNLRASLTGRARRAR